MSRLPNDTRRVKSFHHSSGNRHLNVTLSSLIGEDLVLRKVGREHMGLCPFHGEHTPSFSVNDEKGVYYCFGCGASGDAIDYLRQIRGYTFAEACQKTGKERPRSDRTIKARPRDVQDEQARYWAWWREKLRAWNQLLDDIRWTEATYREQCDTLGETMSDRSYSFWSQRLGDLYFQHTLGQHLLDLTDAERFAAWREETGNL